MQILSVRGAAAPATSPTSWPKNLAIPGHEDVVVGRAAHLACVSSQNTRLSQLACHSPIWPLLACSTPSK
jgi:hypothetical protein